MRSATVSTRPAPNYAAQFEHAPGRPPPIVDEVLRSSGASLDTPTRAYMEPRFGHDFSRVRVHSGENAAASAFALGAEAYAVGRDIVFAADAFAPETSHGREVLAHELAHTIQQQGASGGPPVSVGSGGGGKLEASAKDAARTAANGGVLLRDLPACGMRIQRSPAPDERWKNDVGAARYRGRLVARRIRKHGLLSKEAREKINQELAYFEGAAKQTYLDEVKPVLVRTVETEMPATSARRVPKVPEIRLDGLAPDPRQISDEELKRPQRELEQREGAEETAERTAEIAKLEAKTADWPREYRDFAVDLLTSVLIQAKRTNIDPRAISDRIRPQILQKFRLWLENQDELMKEVCEHMPDGVTGAIRKSQARFQPALDPCRRWFADEYSHGPSELHELESRLRLNRLDSGGETPAEYVYYDVFELLKKVDPRLLQEAEDAASMVSGLAATGGARARAGAAENLGATQSGRAGSALAESRSPTVEAGPSPRPEPAPQGASGAPSATIKSSPPPPPRQVQRPGAPTPVTDVELVKANISSPDSIKVKSPTDHQVEWNARGGPETAPPAYRDGQGNVHVSADHPLMASASRGGIPPVSSGARSPAGPTPSRPSPDTPRVVAIPRGEVGTADTGQAPAPAPPAVDPMAGTPAAPVPAQAPPAAQNVAPGAQTGAAGAASRQPQAPRRGFDPPQPVSPEAVEKMRSRPPQAADPRRKGRGSNVNYSTNHKAHELAWRRLGGQGDSSPPGFIYDNQVYLDPSRWSR